MSNGHYRVALGASRLAAVIILVSGGATLALAVLMPLSAAPRAVLVAWIGAAMFDAYRAVALRAGRGVREIVLHGGEVLVADALGRRRAGLLRDGSFVAPFLTIIRWRPHGARLDCTIVILPDMLSPARFRELRVLLKWGQIPFPA